MPIYEFSCNKCSNCFELLCKIEYTKPICPKCSSKRVDRLISSGGFDLKGVGNYKDGRS